MMADMMFQSYVVVLGILGGVWVASRFYHTGDAALRKVAYRFLFFMTTGGVITSLYHFVQELEWLWRRY